jgi:hypothetical protein
MRRSGYRPRAWRVGSYHVTDGLQPAGQGDGNASADTYSHEIEVEGGRVLTPLYPPAPWSRDLGWLAW